MNKRLATPIRVLLTEHQTLVRVGIKTILESENDIKIIAEAETGAKGFELFQRVETRCHDSEFANARFVRD